MLQAFTLIVCCQLIGELIVTALQAPLPGPVLGMALLFSGLLLRGSIPDDLGSAADGLLANLSLLFVPAGTGIMLHVGLISRDLVPITASIVVSTIASIAVTSLMMSALSHDDDKADPGSPAPGTPGNPTPIRDAADGAHSNTERPDA